MAVAAGALVLAAPAAADDSDGWEISSNGTSCTMLSTYEDNVSVALLWGTDGDVSFMAAGGDLEKSAGKAGGTVPLTVRFDGDVPHREWKATAAQVVAVGTRHVGVIADWGPELGKEFADTVARSGNVSIRVGDRDLGSYDLSGSREASASLMACGTQLASR
jgi:hypothetical protein